MQCTTQNDKNKYCISHCSELLAYLEQVPADIKAKIEDKIKELREKVTADDIDGMKKGMETLQQEVMAMGQAMYQQGQQPGAAPGAGADAGAGPAGGDAKKPNDDNVIDAEFTDKK